MINFYIPLRKLKKNILLLKSKTGYKKEMGAYILIKIGIPLHSLCAIVYKKEKTG